MIHPLILPKIEPNMEEAMITEWCKKEDDPVQKGEILFNMETAKAIIEVEAEYSGYLRKIIVGPGKNVPVLSIVGFIGDKDEPLPDVGTTQKQPSQKEKAPEKDENKNEEKREALKGPIEVKIKATPAARRLAQEKNIDLVHIQGKSSEGIITEEDVRTYIQSLESTSVPDETPRRVIILGAGNGGEVVANILLQEGKHEIIGFLDDKELLWGQLLLGKPVLGKMELVHELFRSGKATAAIISITSNMKVRKKLYLMLKEHNYLLVNAIHPRACLEPSVKVGEGNVIGAFVYAGYGAVIGNNNLITAHCDIEHHNRIGSHILFGPGVMTSGDVTIDDECSLGAGVNVEPHVRIGNNVAIASGSTIISDVPPFTVIKKEIKL